MARLPPRTDLKLRTDPAISYYLTPEEKLKQCPYEKSHMILDNKFVLHLTKCRRNYILNQKKRGKPVEIDVCRFSSFHHVKKTDLAHHEANCPTRLQEELDTAFFSLDGCIPGTTVKMEDLHEFDREKEKELTRQKEEVEKVKEAERKAQLKLERKLIKHQERFGLNEIVGGGPSCFYQHGDPSKISKAQQEESWEDEDAPKRTWEETTKDKLWGANFPGVKDYTAKFESAARRNILLNPQGLTKSERRDYRELVGRIVKERQDESSAEGSESAARREPMAASEAESVATYSDLEYSDDEDEQQEVQSNAGQSTQPRGRFNAVHVGFPGWELLDGDRRSEKSYKGGV